MGGCSCGGHRDAGADAFLSRPFDEADLLARFRAWTRVVTLQEEHALRHQESTRLTSELISLNTKIRGPRRP